VKIIVSHDVDHMTPWEHRTDLVVPKLVARFGIEWLTGLTRGQEVRAALRSLYRGQWQRIDELMDFDEANGISSTFSWPSPTVASYVTPLRSPAGG
jgi:hypothetical protein